MRASLFLTFTLILLAGSALSQEVSITDEYLIKMIESEMSKVKTKHIFFTQSDLNDRALDKIFADNYIIIHDKQSEQNFVELKFLAYKSKFPFDQKYDYIKRYVAFRISGSTGKSIGTIYYFHNDGQFSTENLMIE